MLNSRLPPLASNSYKTRHQLRVSVAFKTLARQVVLRSCDCCDCYTTLHNNKQCSVVLDTRKVNRVFLDNPEVLDASAVKASKVHRKECLYSQVTKMCISKVEHPKCKLLNRNAIGGEVRGVLTRARVERRLICGLLPAITYLEQNPDNALLCMLPQTRSGDAASHMQTVLLQAFCYENYIPVIQVDSSERLAEFCGIAPSKGRPAECFCAIITRDPNHELNPDEDPPLSPSEQTLTDFYECTLEEYPRPIVHLPPITAT